MIGKLALGAPQFQSNIPKEIAMIKYFVAAVSSILLFAAGLPAKSDTLNIPAEIVFPSSVGEVTFEHQVHIQDRKIECVQCHHQLNAKKLLTPHPDYFDSATVKCGICHDGSEKIKQQAYMCSECHRATPASIADETLSAKVVIHKKCWECHQVGTGKEASKSCQFCHSGKKN